MASIQKRVRNGKTTYRVQYRDPAGRMRGKVFARMADAKSWLVENEYAKGHNAWTDPRAGKATLREYAEGGWPRRPSTGRPARQSRCGCGCTSTRSSAATSSRRCA